VSTPRITRIGLISLGLLSFPLCVKASDTNSRPASLEEIQTLFNLATVWPQRQRLVADVTTYETKWSQEEIATAIEQQNEKFPDMRRLPESVQRDRTNAVAAGHSGIQILHVQEWDSGNLYRLDQTEEGLLRSVSPQYLKYLEDHPGTYWQSFVDIDDLAFSPYRSFNVNRQLHDIQLSKTALWAKDDLWRARGLDAEMFFPLLAGLLDSKSLAKGRPGTDADSGILKLDPAKAMMIHNGSHPNWHLEAIPEGGQENRTRFIMSAIKPYGLRDQEFVYVVGRVEQRPVCLEASLTNYTTHASFFSKREDFDSHGFPRVWKRTTLAPGSPARQIDVVFKDVELNATFDDKQVFLPVFPTNYIVSDVTSGNAKILQHSPHSRIARPEPQANSGKRLIILCVFGLVTLWLGIRLFRYKRNSPIV
jgi:hypothetical protein